jgi:hypothetical protein
MSNAAQKIYKFKVITFISYQKLMKVSKTTPEIGTFLTFDAAELLEKDFVVKHVEVLNLMNKQRGIL